MTPIEFSQPSENGELMLFDISGRVVKIISVHAGTKTLLVDCGDLTEGIYFYNLFTNEKLSEKGKIKIS